MRILLQHLRAQDIGRHQIGGELHPAGIEAEHRAQRFHQLGLAQARHTHQQHMAAGEQGDGDLLNHRLLAENHPADGGAGAAELFSQFFGLGEPLCRFCIQHVSHPARSLPI